ncbi:hypothetical protein [Sporomusa acidovorans]|uniref:Uncharacterized protein n=1 Tax=Sporomusa acidovorans (strain ATCC 49682 / DSM 3132 / Mol) TaxID=1123286 RepID=A0ABZ3IW76_SPOA4|nr:hypothetical protein [Sporomusa acidovorans]OZC18000.1 hypothetical protein SPACI_36270 [Sporomusa acidovorans DSM 3132]SDF42486.1 hypothetical protein SAMN04488499_104826 [Sporomusa acidovorans]
MQKKRRQAGCSRNNAAGWRLFKNSETNIGEQGRLGNCLAGALNNSLQGKARITANTVFWL